MPGGRHRLRRGAGVTKKKASHTQGGVIAVGAWVEAIRDDAADLCNCDPASMGQSGMRSDEETRANARRIAACWNACDGISTDALESNGSAVMGWTRTASKLIQVAKERDALLAAIKQIKAVSGTPEKVWKIAVEAIAAAKTERAPS